MIMLKRSKSKCPVTKDKPEHVEDAKNPSGGPPSGGSSLTLRATSSDTRIQTSGNRPSTSSRTINYGFEKECDIEDFEDIDLEILENMDEDTLGTILENLEEQNEKVELELKKVMNEARITLAEAVLAQEDLQRLREEREEIIKEITRIGGEEARKNALQLMDEVPVRNGVTRQGHVPAGEGGPIRHDRPVREIPSGDLNSLDQILSGGEKGKAEKKTKGPRRKQTLGTSARRKQAKILQVPQIEQGLISQNLQAPKSAKRKRELAGKSMNYEVEPLSNKSKKR